MYAVQLPGRRDRIREKPIHSVREIIDQLAPILSNFSEGNSIFFGHSLGAILAYEMATRLQKDSGSGPQHVIVSGHNAPDQPFGYVPISDLPTAAFFRELNSLGGMDPNVFGNEELMDLMEPALRSDIKANEDYRRMTNQRLLCHRKVIFVCQTLAFNRQFPREINFPNKFVNKFPTNAATNASFYLLSQSTQIQSKLANIEGTIF